MAEETTVRSVRASKEVFDRLTELTKESFGNTNSALEALLNAWDIQSAKETMGEAKSAIADFDMHVQAIQRGYLHALDLIKGADARALDTVRAQLQAKDETIIALRSKAEVAERRAQEAETHAAEWQEKATGEAEKAEAAKRRAETAESTLARTEATAATQINDKEKLIHSLTTQVAELSEQARQNATAIAKTASLREELERTKRELEDAKTAAIVADAKATAEKALAVSAAREEASTRLLQLTDENAALRVEIERAKAKITLLESPKEMQAANTAPMNDQQTPPAPEEDTSNVGKDAKRQAKADASRKRAAPKKAKKGTEKTEKKEVPGLEEAKALIDAWAEYRETFRASFEGENAVGGMIDISKPSTTIEDYLKNHPAAAAYLRAEEESQKNNYELASIGKKALDRITANPDEYAAAIEQMDADISAFTDRHMWD